MRPNHIPVAIRYLLDGGVHTGNAKGGDALWSRSKGVVCFGDAHRRPGPPIVLHKLRFSIICRQFCDIVVADRGCGPALPSTRCDKMSDRCGA